MLCPVCKGTLQASRDADSGLYCHTCPGCLGRWIASHQYWKWRDASGKSLADGSVTEAPTGAVKDTAHAKLCPECGHFLRRFPVGHGLGFGLDRCGNCGGVWFDCNEWETLKSRNLHGDVHKIFSEIWQRRIRGEEHQAAIEALYRQKFGDDYPKAMEIKAWIAGHPKQAELRAYLGF